MPLPLPVSPAVHRPAPAPPPSPQLREVSARFGCLVVCDRIADERPVTVAIPADADRAKAVALLATALNRDVLVDGDVVVLRSRHGFGSVPPPPPGPADSPLTLRPVRPVKPASIATPLQIHGDDVSLQALADAFAAQTPWRLQIEAELADRRVAVYGVRVTPAQVADALALLIQASPTIVLERSDARKRMDKDRLSGLPEELADQAERSRQLRKKLEQVLTPEEAARMRDGKVVDVTLKRLDRDTARACLDLMKDRARSTVPGLLGYLDANRMDQLRVSLMPPAQSPFGLLGTVLIDGDGAEHRF